MANSAEITVRIDADDVVRRIPELRAALRLARAADAWESATIAARRVAGYVEYRAALEEWRRVAGDDSNG